MIAEVVTPANNGVFDWCPRGDRHRNPMSDSGRTRDHLQ
jgi:hypothetical protein